jgi:class 3 adenylate cyclase
VSDVYKESFFRSVSRQILRSRKPVTILFTDVEDSTAYWDEYGDLDGRLMIDLHNRLISPVIKKYRGKIVKHIGDSIMASFKSARNALQASIAIQQILEKRRNEDVAFRLRVRIGVHAGKALVEGGDIFGDAVNLAARVKGLAKGGEIYVSSSTASLFQKEDFALTKVGNFRFKGKQTEIAVYKCQWRQYSDLIAGIEQNIFVQVLRRQKLEFLIYSCASIGIIYFLFFNYLRYFLADKEPLALLSLRLQLILDARIAIPAALGILTLVVVFLAIRTKIIPHSALSLLKGGFGLAIGFLLFYGPAHYLHYVLGPDWNKTLHQSDHLFVEVLEDKVSLHRTPSEASAAIFKVPKGTILLLADVAKRRKMAWNKVLVGRGKYGWIPRIVPAKIGVPKRRLSIANKFYFTYLDFGALVAGLAGFFWGVFSFRVRPI